MNRKQLLEKLDAHIAKHRLKSTAQRNVIVDVFLNMGGKHVTIEDLLQAVRRKNPRIGYATVYRTLKLLVGAGIASQRQFNDGQSLFEIAEEKHHDHLICTHCGKIIEFENQAIEKLQDKIAADFQFTLSGHRMELYGVCNGMKTKGVCSFKSKN